jgi:hypothetical protein
MKHKFFLLFLLTFFLGAATCLAQNKKIDTTVKIGRVGYKVYSNNKSVDKNILTITPDGFERGEGGGAREMSFYAGGIVAKAEIDDLNNDGFPDLLVYIYTGHKGTVIVVTSNENKSCSPVYFPNILDDPKLRAGYRGFDEFSMLEGSLMRKFPIYNTADTDSLATGGKRIIQYRMIPSEGGSKLKVERSYEIK